ncbi:HDOD domain-containing protein [Pontibacterium sp.]|uniref:HDOD domain-containing protein n=1 Tax=Pontibacterium sp. TaxID=2036026 RepID=UPI0035150D5C
MTDALTLQGKTLRLPVISPGAATLMQQLSDDTIPFDQLAAVIERFPTITARLIALANSAWAGSAREVTNLPDACTRLGFNVVRSTSIALIVSAPFNPNRCPLFSPVQYWRDSMLIAEAAFGLSSNQLPEPLCDQTMRTMGLLHNLGLLWLADSMPEETQAALTLTLEDSGISLSEALIRTCGFDYAVAAEALCTTWQLPDAITRVLAHQNDPHYRDDLWQGPELLRLSKAMIKQLGEATPDSLTPLENDALGISFSDLRAEYRRLEKLHPRINELASTLFLA